jgi:hypothetical protein
MSILRQSEDGIAAERTFTFCKRAIKKIVKHAMESSNYFSLLKTDSDFVRLETEREKRLEHEYRKSLADESNKIE